MSRKIIYQFPVNSAKTPVILHVVPQATGCGFSCPPPANTSSSKVPLEVGDGDPDPEFVIFCTIPTERVRTNCPCIVFSSTGTGRMTTVGRQKPHALEPHRMQPLAPQPSIAPDLFLKQAQVSYTPIGNPTYTDTASLAGPSNPTFPHCVALHIRGPTRSSPLTQL